MTYFHLVLLFFFALAMGEIPFLVNDRRCIITKGRKREENTFSPYTHSHASCIHVSVPIACVVCDDACKNPTTNEILDETYFQPVAEHYTVQVLNKTRHFIQYQIPVSCRCTYRQYVSTSRSSSSPSQTSSHSSRRKTPNRHRSPCLEIDTRHGSLLRRLSACKQTHSL